jgi:hypothetical protein
MSRECFVCLNTTKNKVCTTCECYAHYHCWGKFLKNYTNVITYIYEEEILITVPLYVNCPQCNRDIANVKPVTRSDTRFGRRTFLRIRCQNMFDYANLTEDLVKKSAIFKNIFETIFDNKNLLRKGSSFRNMIKNKLISLQNSGDWKFANFYHLKIFGKQIK